VLQRRWDVDEKLDDATRAAVGPVQERVRQELAGTGWSVRDWDAPTVEQRLRRRKRRRGR
jgi:hypothetical protein